MEITEILSRFEKFTGNFEREAVEEAVARRDEVIPGLLHILAEIADPERAARIAAEGDLTAHMYAVYLLAQFREVRAYPLLLRIARLPGDLIDSLLGDFITEDLGRVLASVSGGDLEGIEAIIEDEEADEWVRDAAFGSLVTLVAAGVRSREEVVSYFAGLYRGNLKNANDIVWAGLVSGSCDLYPEELLGDIERSFQAGLVDPGNINMEDVKRELAMGRDSALARLQTNPHRQMVVDTVKEYGKWACFHKEEPPAPHDATEIRDGLGSQWPDRAAPFKRTAPKIGRNDRCPCGSGKKYKKCCGK
ncbi:MAG: DUF1186 domain-containing protein [Terracidiphilus sp.]